MKHFHLKKEGILILFVFLLCGCQKAGKPPVTSSENLTKEADWKPVEKELLGNLKETVSGNGKDVDTKDTIEEIKKKLEKAGTQLEDLIQTGKDDLYYCNPEANIRLMYGNDDTRNNLVCRDPVYRITYYVNYGRDYFIYAMRGDDMSSVLAVPVPATDIYCREGRVYFIAKEYEHDSFLGFEGLKNGTILCYDPADGSITIVTEQTADRMNVYPDGILFNKDRWKENERNYYFSFKTGELTVVEGWGRDRLAEYRIVEKEEETNGKIIARFYEFEDKEGNVVKRFNDFLPTADSFWLPEVLRPVGQILYGVEVEGISKGSGKHTLVAYHMDTGVREELQTLKGVNGIWDFILYDGLFVFMNYTCVDAVTGEETEWWPDLSVIGQTSSLGMAAIYERECFYTDGMRLFSLQNQKLYVAELVRMEDREIEGSIRRYCMQYFELGEETKK